MVSPRSTAGVLVVQGVADVATFASADDQAEVAQDAHLVTDG
jgi:hypothetical protein